MWVQKEENVGRTPLLVPTHTCLHYKYVDVQAFSRSDVMAAGLTALAGLGVALPALAAEEGRVPAMSPVDLSVAPKSFELSKEYYKDATQVVNHMK